MFCKNCGTKMVDGAKFCGNCGCQVESEVAKINETVNANETVNTKEVTNEREVAKKVKQQKVSKTAKESTTTSANETTNANKRSIKIPIIPIIVVVGIVIIGFVVKTVFLGGSSSDTIKIVAESSSDVLVDEKETIINDLYQQNNINLDLQSETVKVVTEYSPDTLVDDMDTVTFGSYPQSDISGDKKDPIEWLVLEKNDNEMLLLSKYILDCKCYNDEQKDVTWETCTLRKWLNNKFYNIAFSKDEKKCIIKSNVENKDNSEYDVSGGKKTKDYVYILSVDECRKYFGNEDDKKDNNRLATKGTVYAKNVDNYGEKLWVSYGTGRTLSIVWKEKPSIDMERNVEFPVVGDDIKWRGNSDFWLRSPGYLQSNASGVMDCGHVVSDDCAVNSVGVGIRPLIRVKYMSENGSNKQNNINVGNNKVSKDGWDGDYYYKDGEKLMNSWVEDYYIGEDGKYVRNTWVGDYYIGEDGKYVKNTWAKYENDWYYCGNDGKIVKNDWVDNQNYYVDGSGKMLKNTTTPDGYYVGGDGKYINETVNNKKEVKVSKFIYDKNLKTDNAYSSNTLVAENEKVANDHSSDILIDENIKTVGEYSHDTLVDEMDTVTFGSYPQSDISGKKKDPIKWIVLEKDDSEMLLLSKFILDCKCYNDRNIGVTWETSTLRKWLNDTFYNNAFSDDEKTHIIKSYVENKDNSEYGTSGGNDTNDYVYSLSIDECRKYFGNEHENKRLATNGTEYAKNVDNHSYKLWVSDATEWYGGNSVFWLRSPGNNQNNAADVSFGGYVLTFGDNVALSPGGLRPLLKVKYR